MPVFQNLLLEAVADGERREAHEHAGDLLDWLRRGGFLPGGGRLRESAIREFCNWVKTTFPVDT